MFIKRWSERVVFQLWRESVHGPQGGSGGGRCLSLIQELGLGVDYSARSHRWRRCRGGRGRGIIFLSVDFSSGSEFLLFHVSWFPAVCRVARSRWGEVAPRWPYSGVAIADEIVSCRGFEAVPAQGILMVEDDAAYKGIIRGVRGT